MIREFSINETKTAISRLANGETRMIVGTISGTKAYRFCAAQTHWFDGQEIQPPSVSFRSYETSRPINAPKSMVDQRKAVLSHPEVLAALSQS